MTAIKVKGAAILARQTFVRDEYGEGAWTKILQNMSAEDRAELEGTILASTWHPFEFNDRLDSAIVEVLGEGSKEIFESIGRASARQNLEGPHRAFAARRDPAWFLSATDRIYGFYYDKGYRTYEETGPNSGVITTFDAETFSQTDCLTVIGWYKEALLMCGASDVEMVEEACRANGDPVCRYRISWKD
ncbi:MAG: TIGR02265 family protein [Thermoanaerobaculia bacterium]